MYKSLQSCRAIAAMLVLFFHLGKAIADDKYFAMEIFAKPFLFAGSAGVDFFFVLSGFIIYYVHKSDFSRPERLGNYLFKRVTRIYPTYWIIFFTVYFTMRAIPSLSNAAPDDLLLLVKALLLIPMDRDIVGGTGAPVLFVAWSLQYEIVFYALFALAIVDRRLGIAAAVVVTIMYVVGNNLDDAGFPLSFLAYDGILLFFMGMMAAAYCAYSQQSLQNARWVFLAGLLLFVTVAVEFNLATGLLAGNYTPAFGFASMLLVIGLIGIEDRGSTLLGSPMFQLLGNSSYALYLLHHPIISVLCKLSMALGMKSWGLAGALVSFVFIAIFCLAVAAGFYLYLEKPLAKKIRQYRRQAGR